MFSMLWMFWRYFYFVDVTQTRCTDLVICWSKHLYRIINRLNSVEKLMFSTHVQSIFQGVVWTCFTFKYCCNTNIITMTILFICSNMTNMTFLTKFQPSLKLFSPNHCLLCLASLFPHVLVRFAWFLFEPLFLFHSLCLFICWLASINHL